MARKFDSRTRRRVLPLRMRLTPIVTVMLGSAITLLPIHFGSPLLPPLGFMILLSWRLLRSDIYPVWIGAPLGLFDDLASGQPVGTAVALWTVFLIAMDILDRRVIWRGVWLDWEVAACALLLYLPLAAMFARAGDIAHIFQLIWPQMVFSIMLMPAAMRITARLDEWRRGL